VPELPEVETVVGDLRPQLVGRRFERVALLLPKLVRYPKPAGFVSGLMGAQVETVSRRGKYIVVPLARSERRLVVHLGMTGHLRIWDAQEPLARHTHLRIGLDDGRELRYDDQRQFGRLLLGVEDELRSAGALPKLGPEPIGDSLTEAGFGALIRRRHRPVKAALLDQSFLAGLGNIYADEACFAAGIRPTRMTHRLAVRERQALFEAIGTVLRKSIAARGSSVANYVDGFGVAGRNQETLQVYGRAGRPCFRCGTPLKSLQLAGRTTVYCPTCQR
jgi:formamidopyrimidine-DNA glycosylase